MKEKFDNAMDYFPLFFAALIYLWAVYLFVFVFRDTAASVFIIACPVISGLMVLGSKLIDKLKK
jgi:ABC-type transport system involved in cytochrome bd biosynthesis fused ATPase/permease subunit